MQPCATLGATRARCPSRQLACSINDAVPLFLVCFSYFLIPVINLCLAFFQYKFGNEAPRHIYISLHFSFFFKLRNRTLNKLRNYSHNWFSSFNKEIVIWLSVTRLKREFVELIISKYMSCFLSELGYRKTRYTFRINSKRFETALAIRYVSLMDF